MRTIHLVVFAECGYNTRAVNDHAGPGRGTDAANGCIDDADGTAQETDTTQTQNADSVSIPIPESGAASTIFRTTRAPAMCPAVRGRPRAFAQRPLPSIMMAT